jgi:hypothetical protein
MIALVVSTARAGEPFTLAKDTGYRGIWYKISQGDEIKYSGGMATYPQQIRPLAIYSKEANKTFFVYGGRSKEKNELLHMISYFDHATGMVPWPRILLNKHTGDAHDNPAIAIDADGYIWIFSNTHGPEKRSFIHRSTKPYSIDAFEQITQTSFSYGQPWYFAGHGFLFINNRYTDGRAVAFQTSADGREWSSPKLLAQMPKGHYQISAPSADGKRFGVAFNYHPHGLDSRTNLYYIETSDFGATWHNIKGDALTTPLKEVKNAALVHDYESEGLLVYLKDIQFDANDRPILVFLNSKDHMPGTEAGVHQWRTAQWTGDNWRIRDAMTSDHNYDFGQLYLEKSSWKLIAPTDPGPSPNWTGGDIVMWTSGDEGSTWKKFKTLTHDPVMHHNYVRQPLNANDQFYAFWADGDPSKPSDSHLYFTDREGSHVWKLPEEMSEEFSKPEIVTFPGK